MQIITMATSNNNYSLKWNEHGVVMEMEFRRLLEVREGVDLKIVCEDGEFWGHRIVVGMGSEFLRGVVGEGEVKLVRKLLFFITMENIFWLSCILLPTKIIPLVTVALHLFP